MFKKGFTLAEVMIVIVIIGVVAAMLITPFYVKYQKRIVCTKLKKVYSTLERTIELSRMDNGDPVDWDWPSLLTFYTGGKDFAEKYFTPYLNIGADYSMQNNGRGMGIPNNALIGDKTTFYIFYPYQLTDGTLISFASGMYNKNTNEPSVVFTVDINGKDKPNILGKDIFKIIYYSKKGFYSSNYYNQVKYTYWKREKVISDCKNTNYTTYCFDIIKDNNWEMPDDYPW